MTGNGALLTGGAALALLAMSQRSSSPSRSSSPAPKAPAPEGLAADLARLGKFHRQEILRQGARVDRLERQVLKIAKVLNGGNMNGVPLPGIVEEEGDE